MANLGYIQVNRQCNQNCRFCSNPETGKELTVQQAMDMIDVHIRQGYDGVILTGGEPTLFPYLAELIAYCHEKDMPCRVITNGQKTADPAYLNSLLHAGLRHIHLSIHSHHASVQAQLTGNHDSLSNIVRSLFLLRNTSTAVDINQTICAQNADHLDQTARWICDNFPFVHHFSWTFLDPYMNRVADHPETIPTLAQCESSLLACMEFLEGSGRTFRLEKVPLCYMGEFAYASTETRAIVKGDERIIHFLDDRGDYREQGWRYQKAPICDLCSLSDICAGLWDLGGAYDASELRPQHRDAEEIIKRILTSE